MNKVYGLFFGILKFSMAVRLRGHKQRKLNDHVYSFLSFCPLGLIIKLDFHISKTDLVHKWPSIKIYLTYSGVCAKIISFQGYSLV